MLLDVLSGDADKAIQVSDELLKEVTQTMIRPGFVS